jgi:hypothetical protein
MKMATTKLGNTKSASRAINYAEKRAEEKSGLNCDVDYAKSAFKQTRALYGKEDGIQAHTIIKSEDNTNDLHEIIEQLKSSNNTLKSERDTFKEKANLFDLFLEHVNENAFIDFDSFKHDTELRKAIMNFKKDRETF